VDGELAVDATAPPTASAEPPVDVTVDAAPAAAIARGVWQPITPMPIPARTRHTATWTGEELLVFGGQPFSGDATGARYDPRTDTWRPMATSPLGSRVGHTATWTGAELIVIEGAPVGRVAAVAAQSLDGAAYDPSTDTWRPIADMPINPRTGHVAVWTGEVLVVYGGSRTFETQAAAALYDPVADRWTTTTPSPLARAYGQSAAVWTGEEVVIWTGRGEADVAAWDPASGSWRLLSAPPIDLRSPSAVWTGEEMLLLGRSTTVGGAALDVAQDRWAVLPPAPQQFGVTAAVSWTGESAVVVAGPADQPGVVWTPSLVRWDVLPAVAQPALSGHSATWVGDALVLLGGQGPGAPMATGAVLRPAEFP
jgi:hypothetical protein